MSLDQAGDIRLALRDAIRPHLVSEAQRRAAAESTNLSFNTINTMMYAPARGGIRAWQMLLLHVHDISPARWDGIVHEVRRALASDLQTTKGQRRWEELGHELSEPDLEYYVEVVRALRAIRQKAREG